MTGLHRKHVIQLMNGPLPHRKKRRRQRGRKYGATKSGSYRIRRKQDVARTPLERLLEKESLGPARRHLSCGAQFD